jgi:thioredoxin reductase (NADPH)
MLMESLAIDLTITPRTPLAGSHIARIREIGEEVRFKAGEVFVPFAAPVDSFCLIEEGEAEAVDPLTGGRYLTSTLGPGQYAGEIALLSGGVALLGMRAVTDLVAVRVAREAILSLMAAIPEMSDIIVTTLAGRRRRLLETNKAGLTLIGVDQSREVRAIAAFAGRNRIPVRIVEPDGDEAAILAANCSLNPGAPALIVEDLTVGGQAGTSSRIENYMGFPTGISGADLCWRGEVQATKFVTRFAFPRRAVALTPARASSARRSTTARRSARKPWSLQPVCSTAACPCRASRISRARASTTRRPRSRRASAAKPRSS